MLRSIPQIQASKLLSLSCRRFVRIVVHTCTAALESNCNLHSAFVSISSPYIRATHTQSYTANSPPMDLLLLLWIQVRLLSKKYMCTYTVSTSVWHICANSVCPLILSAPVFCIMTESGTHSLLMVLWLPHRLGHPFCH